MRKLIAIVLVLVMVLSLNTWTFASATTVQHNYSTQANSGIRDEVCNTLSGTRVGSYYTGSYTIDTLLSLNSSTLLQQLRTLMTNTHSKSSSYNDCRDMAVKTDCENESGNTINLLYSSYTVTRSDFGGSGSTWNREHVWPKSLGGFETSGPGADLHHIRPTDATLNSKRGNLKYGNVSGGSNVIGTSLVDYMVGGTSGGGYFEPLDNVKGDVARICLYVYVRYGGSYTKCSSITNVFQSVDVLLEWMEEDPVDTWDMGRNEVVSAYQGNRNVFIDYPELAWQLFGKEVPADMVTPSGIAAGGSAGTPPTQDPPVVNPPADTEPPVTEPPVSEPPVTEPPVTNPPVTEPPVTNPPATQPSDTEPPVTDVPTTDAPAGTTAPSTPADPSDPPSNELWNDITLWIVLAVVILGAATAVVIIIIKKKRSA